MSSRASSEGSGDEIRPHGEEGDDSSEEEEEDEEEIQRVKEGFIVDDEEEGDDEEVDMDGQQGDDDDEDDESRKRRRKEKKRKKKRKRVSASEGLSADDLDLIAENSGHPSASHKNTDETRALKRSRPNDGDREGSIDSDDARAAALPDLEDMFNQAAPAAGGVGGRGGEYSDDEGMEDFIVDEYEAGSGEEGMGQKEIEAERKRRKEEMRANRKKAAAGGWDIE